MGTTAVLKGNPGESGFSDPELEEKKRFRKALIISAAAHLAAIGVLLILFPGKPKEIRIVEVNIVPEQQVSKSVEKHGRGKTAGKSLPPVAIPSFTPSLPPAPASLPSTANVPAPSPQAVPSPAPSTNMPSVPVPGATPSVSTPSPTGIASPAAPTPGVPAPSLPGLGTGSKGGGGEEGISWGGEPRRLLYRKNPVLPIEAKKRRVNYSGVFKILVDPQGKVVRVRTVKSTGYPDVDASIQQALYQWRFERGTTSVWGTVKVEINLK